MNILNNHLASKIVILFMDKEGYMSRKDKELTGLRAESRCIRLPGITYVFMFVRYSRNTFEV